jgi:hypothetical protein
MRLITTRDRSEPLSLGRERITSSWNSTHY